MLDAFGFMVVRGNDQNTLTGILRGIINTSTEYLSQKKPTGLWVKTSNLRERVFIVFYGLVFEHEDQVEIPIPVLASNSILHDLIM